MYSSVRCSLVGTSGFYFSVLCFLFFFLVVVIFTLQPSSPAPCSTSLQSRAPDREGGSLPPNGSEWAAVSSVFAPHSEGCSPTARHSVPPHCCDESISFKGGRKSSLRALMRSRRWESRCCFSVFRVSAHWAQWTDSALKSEARWAVARLNHYYRRRDEE